jgi:hypothetical protein
MAFAARLVAVVVLCVTIHERGNVVLTTTTGTYLSVTVIQLMIATDKNGKIYLG